MTKARHIENSAGPRRQLIFGVEVDALTMDETVARVRELVRDGELHQHVVLNAAKVVEMARNERLRRIISTCSLVNVDGSAVVWASWLLGRPVPSRVTGIDLFERLAGVAASDGHSIFLLGAQGPVVEQVSVVLQQRHPGLIVAGVLDGFWTDDEVVVETVRRSGATYLFLAVPSPKKEYWLNDHLQELGVPLVMGVGGAFDVVAGKTRRAPVVMQRLGLEWAWRLLLEPRRMWRRYLTGNTKFVLLTAREVWKTRRPGAHT